MGCAIFISCKETNDCLEEDVVVSASAAERFGISFLTLENWIYGVRAEDIAQIRYIL